MLTDTALLSAKASLDLSHLSFYAMGGMDLILITEENNDSTRTKVPFSIDTGITVYYSPISEITRLGFSVSYLLHQAMGHGTAFKLHYGIATLGLGYYFQREEYLNRYFNQNIKITRGLLHNDWRVILGAQVMFPML